MSLALYWRCAYCGACFVQGEGVRWIPSHFPRCCFCRCCFHGHHCYHSSFLVMPVEFKGQGHVNTGIISTIVFNFILIIVTVLSSCTLLPSFSCKGRTNKNIPGSMWFLATRWNFQFFCYVVRIKSWWHFTMWYLWFSRCIREQATFPRTPLKELKGRQFAGEEFTKMSAGTWSGSPGGSGNLTDINISQVPP